MPRFPREDLFPSPDLYPGGFAPTRPKPEIPHLAWPFARNPDTGKANVVEQGSIPHIQSQEWAVTVCPIGFRLERTDFGWAIPDLRLGHIDAEPLIEALDRLVPSVINRTAEAYMDLADPSKWTLQVTDEIATEQ